jgi:quinolinate synthase
MVRDYKEDYPGLPVVVYVNSTAAVKAEADICCTSSNAVKIVEEISKKFNTKSILFGPDANLADFAEQRTGIKCIPLPKEGNCYVHSQLTVEDIKKSRVNHPEALILVHPECTREVRVLADFVGSTAQMYRRVSDSFARELEFVIGTEQGLIDRMAKDFPEKNYFPARENGMICYNMKKNTIELMRYVMDNLDDPMFEVKVPSEIAKNALKPIELMLNYS